MKKLNKLIVIPTTKIAEPMLDSDSQHQAISMLKSKLPFENDSELRDRIKNISEVDFISTPNTIYFESKNKVAINEAWRLVKTFQVPQTTKELLPQLQVISDDLRRHYGEDNRSVERRLQSLAKHLSNFPADCTAYAISKVPYDYEFFPVIKNFVDYFKKSSSYRESLLQKIIYVAKSLTYNDLRD